MPTNLSEAQERLAITAQNIELTSEQVLCLRKEFEAAMKKYDLLPSELNWLLGSIAAVISNELIAKKRGE